ncbi:hypothetical protein CC86DRAFT_451213 [Ophiobolus disseminans]|uniref:Uncharacterized protein n=1 Tax=Ophiobolus disseminans TaxID=1469910 RepID=A0A6A7AJZ2_9PLEO|nr:hypothetical protein CC86DRAFT_451213 [Ophiobolus disseminans]
MSSNTSPTSIKLLIVGLNVQSAIPQYFRDLYGTPSEIKSKIELDNERIKSAGYDVTLKYLTPAETEAGLEWLEATLKNEKFQGVLLGSGLRLVPDQTMLFEKTMDIVRRGAPDSVFMFNDGPGGNYDAILRNEERLRV